MLNPKKLKSLTIERSCNLSKKKNFHEELADHLLDLKKSFIRFSDFKPYLKLNSHYAEITSDEMLCAAVRKHISSSKRHSITNAAIIQVIECIRDNEKLQVDLETSARENQNLINFSNGVYDISSQKLLTHDIEYKFDYELAAEYIPPEKRELQNFYHFVETSIGNDNKASMLRTIGLAMSSIRDTKKMVIIIGDGNSGKSKICDIIQHGVGAEYVVTNSVDRLGSEKAIASYMGGKRVNLSRDTTIGVIKEDAGFKSVISCEPINGRLLYRNEVSVTPKILCIAASNEFPKFRNADDATLDRIVAIKIQGYEGEPDPDLPAKLLSETNSIVSEAVDTLKEFVDSGYDFLASKDSISLMEHERKKLHAIEAFIDDCCDIADKHAVSSDKPSVSSVELFNKYLQWCEENALDPIGKGKFFDKIKQLVKFAIYKKVLYRQTYVNGFVGIGLKGCNSSAGVNDSNASNDASNKISNGTDSTASAENKPA